MVSAVFTAGSAMNAAGSSTVIGWVPETTCAIVAPGASELVLVVVASAPGAPAGSGGVTVAVSVRVGGVTEDAVAVLKVWAVLMLDVTVVSVSCGTTVVDDTVVNNGDNGSGKADFVVCVAEVTDVADVVTEVTGVADVVTEVTDVADVVTEVSVREVCETCVCDWVD